ncbi:hypothetical protein QWY14_02150 [Planococcus sp. N028]|uniref:Uncharacterized protein n=1 Tax=Planococcus shixiaomingii TaxID=3058393 RepID=A0ABT8MY49_9BACL|nr:hypothetical protein [Planococcus sp. N028]MDN7240569.1 hypothetical protein [Planococcus sp. N028]
MSIKRNMHWKNSQLLLAALSLGIVSGCAFSTQENALAATPDITTTARELADPIGTEVAIQEQNHPTGVIPSPRKKSNSNQKYYDAPGKNTSPKSQSPTQQSPAQKQLSSPEKPSEESDGTKSEVPAPACPDPNTSMSDFDFFMTYTHPAIAYFSNKFSRIWETYWGDLFQEGRIAKYQRGPDYVASMEVLILEYEELRRYVRSMVFQDSTENIRHLYDFEFSADSAIKLRTAAAEKLLAALQTGDGTLTSPEVAEIEGDLRQMLTWADYEAGQLLTAYLNYIGPWVIPGSNTESYITY